MSTAQQIVNAIDALILAKVTGATQLSELTNRTIGALGISMADSLEKLTKLRDHWEDIASRADDTEVVSRVVFE